MVQPQTVPAKKGMSVWAWVAIGCVGILVLGGVVAGGVAWWAAHKMKSMAQEYKAHPEMAAIKMALALNPDVELVSSDDAAGTVTVKNKKTGETVTVNMADVKNGNISFSTPQGQSSSVNFDQQAGKMEIHGANGEVAQIGGEAKLPDWVPAYPGAAPEGVYRAEDATQAGGTFGATTTDSVDDVFAYYKKELEAAGFKVTDTHYSGPQGNGGMVAGESSDSKRTVTFTLATDSGKTRIAGVYAEKKG